MGIPGFGAKNHNIRLYSIDHIKPGERRIYYDSYILLTDTQLREHLKNEFAETMQNFYSGKQVKLNPDLDDETKEITSREGIKADTPYNVHSVQIDGAGICLLTLEGQQNIDCRLVDIVRNDTEPTFFDKYLEQRVIVDFDQLKAAEQKKLSARGIQKYKSYEVVGVSLAAFGDGYILELEVNGKRVPVPGQVAEVVTKYLTRH